jgi:hypothetical protein
MRSGLVLVPDVGELGRVAAGHRDHPGLVGLQHPAAHLAADRADLLGHIDHGFLQHLEVLGDGRLGDAELALDHLAERAGGELAVPEQLQDAAAHRIAEYVERVHQAVDQPAPGGRLAGSSSDRAPAEKSALAPNGRSLSLNTSSPRSHGRAEPHARRGAGTGADHRN